MRSKGEVTFLQRASTETHDTPSGETLSKNAHILLSAPIILIHQIARAEVLLARTSATALTDGLVADFAFNLVFHRERGKKDSHFPSFLFLCARGLF